MSDQMILTNNVETYQAKEAAVLIAAVAFVIAMGGVALAAIAICGWRGASRVTVDWLHGRATFYCR